MRAQGRITQPYATTEKGWSRTDEWEVRRDQIADALMQAPCRWWARGAAISQVLACTCIRRVVSSVSVFSADDASTEHVRGSLVLGYCLGPPLGTEALGR